MILKGVTSKTECFSLNNLLICHLRLYHPKLKHRDDIFILLHRTFTLGHEQKLYL